MGKWNSSDALNIHITVSILSLLLIYTISAGRNVSVALPRIPALIVDGIVLALVIATLVMCFFPDAEYKGRPRLFRILVILVADLMVLPPAIGIFASACNGRREFWGEDRLPENCHIDDSAFDGCGTVYVFAPAGGTTDSWCDEHTGIVFVAEQP